MWAFAMVIIGTFILVYVILLRSVKAQIEEEEEEAPSPKRKKLIVIESEKLLKKMLPLNEPGIEYALLELRDDLKKGEYEYRYKHRDHGVSFDVDSGKDLSGLAKEIEIHFDGRYRADQILFCSSKTCNLKGIDGRQCKVLV